MNLPTNTAVRHPEYGEGVVCPKTAHTHRSYTVVFFPANQDGYPATFSKTITKGNKRRVLTTALEVLL